MNARPIHRSLFALLLTLPLTLNNASAKDALASQRMAFQQAEAALESGDHRSYRRLSQGLQSYPLYPYLQYQALKKRLSSIDSRQAEAFLSQYAKTPLALRFRISWLKELASRRQWWVYPVFYRPGMGTELECHQLNAMLKTGRSGEALEQIRELWLSGRSQPESCDPVFDAWIEAGRLTPDLTWQRIELAMDSGETTLARYLGRYLPENQHELLELWLKIHRSPQQLESPEILKAAGQLKQKILLHGLRRLASRDLERAIRIWSEVKHRLPFSESQSHRMERRLLSAMIDQDHPATWTQMDGFTPEPEDHPFLEKRIRAALAAGDHDRAQRWIKALPAELRESERWRYWSARTGMLKGNAESAKPLLQALAQERSYHGYLAADLLGQGYKYDHTPLETQVEDRQRLLRIPAIQRARELLLLDRLADARREWRWGVQGLSDNELQAAAKLAQSWEWHDQAIFTLAPTEYWDDLELRFPLEHRSRIKTAAQRQRLDNAWVFAVVRQESAFSRDARSPAGALGLMQLMPRTARFIAKKTRQPRPSTRDLFDPETNINLGTAYLGRVLERLGGHQVLATAAYNAGPHRVISWLPEQTMEADAWIETIPFTETRRYVQRVLTYAAIYEQRLGREPTRLQQRMREIRPEDETLAEGEGEKTRPSG